MFYSQPTVNAFRFANSHFVTRRQESYTVTGQIADFSLGAPDLGSCEINAVLVVQKRKKTAGEKVKMNIMSAS
jgi:hypothetical protein